MVITILHILPGIFSNLEGHFCYMKPF